MPGLWAGTACMKRHKGVTERTILSEELLVSCLFYPFAFAFSATETPCSVQISCVNKKGRGHFQSMHSWMNHIKHPMLLLYNTLACWPWPDLLFVVIQWLKQELMCENSLADVGWCRALRTLGAKGKLGGLGCCKCKRVSASAVCEVHLRDGSAKTTWGAATLRVQAADQLVLLTVLTLGLPSLALTAWITTRVKLFKWLALLSLGVMPGSSAREEDSLPGGCWSSRTEELRPRKRVDFVRGGDVC